MTIKENQCYDDGHFTIVFETKDIKEPFKIDPPLVADYFGSGVEITVPSEAPMVNCSPSIGNVYERDRSEQEAALRASHNCIRLMKLHALPGERQEEAVDVVPCSANLVDSVCLLPADVLLAVLNY